jgi:hypothetical protein
MRHGHENGGFRDIIVMAAVKAGAEKQPDKPNLSDVPCRKVCPRDCTRIGWRLAVDDPQGVLAPGHLWEPLACR